MPSNKRAGDDIEGALANATATTTYGIEDVTGSARKKIAGARTGQACDRCKVRKIRCDARPGGCSPCLQNNTECKTTDRITGRATSRGHTETIENENVSLKMHMLELQQQLRDHGVEPKPAPSMQHALMHSQTYWQHDEQQGSWGNLSSNSGLLPTSAHAERHGSQASVLPDFRAGCIGDNYLGVSGNSWLSPIEGTQLEVFGMKIDLAEFLPPESDPNLSAMSYQTFLSHAFGKSQQTYQPALPPHGQCNVYAQWFFRGVQVFSPILHKPHFFKLLSRIYFGHYQPNTAETVMVHMVLAIINYQFAIRNGSEQERRDAMSHYHYALTFIPQLMTGHKLEDIQALALICMQMRSHPRTGPAWMFTNMVLSLAIELGLHRSASAWQGAAAEQDPHIIEMRKRVFWSLMIFQVHISGKLGRPMPLSLEDFDIEIPELIPDDIPSDTDSSKWRKCSFRPAPQAMRQTKILMRLYSTVYSIRSGSESYDVSVQNLEKELEDVTAQLPPELSGGDQTVDDDRCPSLYLRMSIEEIRLLMHHPSICRSFSPQVATNNLDICLDASNKLLSVASQLKAIKCLDSTWYLTMDYLAAIFTTLFVYMQGVQMTSADLQRLRHDMDSWLEVIGEVGSMLGTGARLQEAIRNVIDSSLVNISRNLAAKTASAGLASAGSPTSPTGHVQPQQQQIFPEANGYGHAYSNGSSTSDIPNSSSQPYSMTPQGSGQRHNSYPSTTHLYPEPQSGSMPPFTSASVQAFDPSTYVVEDMKPVIEAQLDAHNSALPQQQIPQSQAAHHTHHGPQLTPHTTPAAFLATAPFQSPVHGQNGFDAPTTAPTAAGPAAWRYFTDNMIPNVSGQEYMASANGLMALGQKQEGTEMSAANVASMGGLQMAPANQPWPLITYNTRPGDEQ